MMTGKRFARRKEDFACLHCGMLVVGTGYTDHCPKCLWSRHVDVNPGDRAEECGGMMRPVGMEKSGSGYRIIEQCERCGFERPSRLREDDDFDRAVAIVAEFAEEKTKTNTNEDVVESVRD